MLAFDHVLVAVPELNAAAHRLEMDYGLASLPGGRHVGLGTANRIVPLGPDYVELIAVVDESEAEASPLAAWVRALTQGGTERLAALCLRTDDLDSWGKRLRSEPVAMSRANDDGSQLSWRLVGLNHMLSNPPHPFFIQWDVPMDRHPGRSRAAHRAPPRGIAWVELSGRVREMRELLVDHELDIRLVDGEPGISGLGITTAEGEIVVR